MQFLVIFTILVAAFSYPTRCLFGKQEVLEGYMEFKGSEMECVGGGTFTFKYWPPAVPQLRSNISITISCGEPIFYEKFATENIEFVHRNSCVPLVRFLNRLHPEKSYFNWRYNLTKYGE